MRAGTRGRQGKAEHQDLAHLTTNLGFYPWSYGDPSEQGEEGGCPGAETVRFAFFNGSLVKHKEGTRESERKQRTGSRTAVDNLSDLWSRIHSCGMKIILS